MGKLRIHAVFKLTNQLRLKAFDVIDVKYSLITITTAGFPAACSLQQAAADSKHAPCLPVHLFLLWHTHMNI
jgi:hypothetical protein